MEAQSIPQPTTNNQQLKTVVSRNWTDDWISQVAEVENRLGRAVCGSRMISGRPCELEPNHVNGRCKFHGGFDLTGAPKGNRNAMIHGLYSRRLRVCSPECPQWHGCPASGPGVAQLDPVDRPTCPYEQTEYNAALTDCLSILHNVPLYNGFMHHLAHNMALLQVMLGRAAISLRDNDLVDNPNTPSLRGVPDEAISTVCGTNSISRPNTPRPRPSAKLQAYLRIQSELRRTYQMLVPKAKESVDASDFEQRSRYRRSMLDDNTAMESNAHRDHWDYVPPDDYDKALYKCSQAQNAAASDHEDAIDLFTQVCALSTEAGHERKDEIIAAWKPHKGGMSLEEFTRRVNELLPP